MPNLTVNPVEWLRLVPDQNWDRTFLIDGQSNEARSFGEFHTAATRVGGSLRSVGLQQGERVAVVAGNSSALGVVYLACLYAGLCVVPLNPALSDDELDYIVRHARPRLLIYDQQRAERFTPARLRRWAVDSSCIDDLLSADANDAVEPLAGVSGNDPSLVVYTSGSTAKPKAVVHSLSALVDNGRLFGEAMGIGSANRFVNLFSMTYLGGYYNALLLPYVCQSSVLLTAGFTAEAALDFWSPIIEHEVDTLWLVPSMLSVLLKMDRGSEGERYCREAVRFALCGTAPLPSPTRDAFELRYGTTLLENYGLSETLFLTTEVPSVGGHEGAVGTPLPGVEMQLVDTHNVPVSRGDEGEIVVRTPYQMRGYYAAESDVIDDPSQGGWFATGDIGHVSGAGLKVTGRKKDLIIRGGVNISPASIEEVIVAHPAVEDCAVIGAADTVLGEEVVAVVKLASGANLETVEREVLDDCHRRLSRIKHPARLVELADFPYTPTGKVQKHKLRAWLESRAPRAAKPISPTSTHRTIGELHHATVVDDVVEAISIKYNNIVYEMQARGEDVIVLSLGEAFFDIPLFGFDDLPFPALYHYSHSRGLAELRELLAEYFLEEYEVAFDPEREIILTAGSKIAIFMALLAVVNPGDEVILHEPGWVSYTEQIKLCRGVPVTIPYSCDVFDFDRFVTDRTKLIIINSPNNPRGKTYDLEELTYLNRLAQERNMYVLSDEAYSDFLLDDSRFVSLGNIDPEKTHTIVVNSISKNFGISGWRVGYAITNETLTQQILKLNQHLVTCPPTILQHYLARHFADVIEITKPQIRDVVQRRRALARYMEEIGLQALEGDATFYFFVSIAPSRLSSTEFCDELLVEDKICAVPGIGYGESCDGFIRASIGAESMERCRTGLERIRALIERTS